jgi:hypothetical protein
MFRNPIVNPEVLAVLICTDVLPVDQVWGARRLCSRSIEGGPASVPKGRGNECGPDRRQQRRDHRPRLSAGAMTLTSDQTRLEMLAGSAHGCTEATGKKDTLCSLPDRRAPCFRIVYRLPHQRGRRSSNERRRCKRRLRIERITPRRAGLFLFGATHFDNASTVAVTSRSGGSATVAAGRTAGHAPAAAPTRP